MSGQTKRSPYNQESRTRILNVETVLHPAEIALLPTRDLRAAVCVVFDVLRATSTFLNALANGAVCIHPVVTVEEARALHTRLPHALLGGERQGVRLEGFDLGNSPREYTLERVKGRAVISTTTNGTAALRACAKGACTVLAGALLNVDALAVHLGTLEPDHLILVCAGTGDHFAWEDGFAAGALLARLPGPITADDASKAMHELYERFASEPLAVLTRSANGRHLDRIGLNEDVEFCARVGTVNLVAELRDGSLTVLP